MSQASTVMLVIAGLVGVAECVLLLACSHEALELWGLPAGSDVLAQASGSAEAPSDVQGRGGYRERRSAPSSLSRR